MGADPNAATLSNPWNFFSRQRKYQGEFELCKNFCIKINSLEPNRVAEQRSRQGNLAAATLSVSPVRLRFERDTNLAAGQADPAEMTGRLAPGATLSANHLWRSTLSARTIDDVKPQLIRSRS
jgi:hypothetical protein